MGGFTPRPSLYGIKNRNQEANNRLFGAIQSAVLLGIIIALGSGLLALGLINDGSEVAGVEAPVYTFFGALVLVGGVAGLVAGIQQERIDTISQNALALDREFDDWFRDKEATLYNDTHQRLELANVEKLRAQDELRRLNTEFDRLTVFLQETLEEPLTADAVSTVIEMIDLAGDQLSKEHIRFHASAHQVRYVIEHYGLLRQRIVELATDPDIVAALAETPTKDALLAMWLQEWGGEFADAFTPSEAEKYATDRLEVSPDVLEGALDALKSEYAGTPLEAIFAAWSEGVQNGDLEIDGIEVVRDY